MRKTQKKIIVYILSIFLACVQPYADIIHALDTEEPAPPETQEPEPEITQQEEIPDVLNTADDPGNTDTQDEETGEPGDTEEPAESGEPSVTEGNEDPEQPAVTEGSEEPATAEGTEETDTPQIPAENTELQETSDTEDPAVTAEGADTPADDPEAQDPDAPQDEPEITVQDVQDNFWNLDVVFFDSAVDDGHTPLTEINWDATADSLNMLPSRTIRVQITYRNTGSDKAYAPGELKLSVPNIMGGQGTPGASSSAYSSNSSHMRWTVDIPANDATHTGFDWEMTLAKDANVYEFVNVAAFEENLNFEGTITLTYNLTPMGEFADRNNRTNSDYPMDELYEDSCTHTVNADVKAELSETADNTKLAESDEITFDYTRTYDHPWTRQQYTLAKNASRVESLELLDNPDDYIWVKYDFVPNPRSIPTVYNWPFYLTQPYSQALGTIPGLSTAYPLIGAYDGYVIDTFPEECVVLDRNHKPAARYAEQTGDGITYKIFPNGNPASYTGDGSFMLYVGYPREIYNEENGNLHITNTADLIGTYGDRTEREVLAVGEVSLDLSDFEFEYQGDLFRVDKYVYMYSNSQYYHYGHSYTNSYLRNLRYQDIINNYSYNETTWFLRPTVRYPGFPYDMVIGDDLLYSTDQSGRVSRVSDEDYYYTNVHYSPSGLHNTSGQIIQTDQYDCELWVRRAGHSDTDYELYDTFRNGMKTSWNFTEDEEIVGFKFVVHDCKEGFTPQTGDAISATTKFRRQDIPREGFLHNFDYLEIWRNVNGEMVLINEPDLDTYATDYTQQEIAAFDQATYGHYLQRGTDKVRWVFYDVPKLQAYLTTRKKQYGTLIQNETDKRFTGTFHIAAGYGNRRMYYPEYHDDYMTDPFKAYLLHGFLFYDLLPEGMELLSTEEEIAASMELGYSEMGWWRDEFNEINQDSYTTIRDVNMNEIRWEEFEELCRENLHVTVERNWNNTNRTKITVDVDLSEHPFYITSHTDNTQTIWSSRLIGVQYDFAIPYSSLEDYGKNFTNSVCAFPEPGDIVSFDSSYRDTQDLNENGNTTEYMNRTDASINITYDAASLQGLTKTVETDHTAFTTSEAFASVDSDYRYRLRITTGLSKVTNVVAYDAIEGYTYFPDGSNKHASDGSPYWQGSLRGVDTSFAQSQGWTVNVYWSSSENPGTLAEDESWQPYTSSTDNTQVKALAFEYLDKNGQPAVLNANYSTQVEILMHSPLAEDETDTTSEKAYNGFWARWNAMDDHGHVIPFIEGIQSNITRVFMNEKTDITVRKEWKDDYEELRPASITVELLADGESAGTAVLNAENGWSYTFEDLWKYNDDGTEIAYAVYEPEVPEYYRVSYTDGKGQTHISDTPTGGYTTAINTYQKKKLYGVKRWEGDTPGQRPESITVHLLRNGEEIDSATTDASRNWKYEFLVDIYDANGNEYEYTVQEDVPEGYRVNYDKDPDHPVTVRFDSRSQTDSNGYSFVRFYYRKDGQVYYTRAYGNKLPSSVNLPTSDFWIYWHSSYSDNNHWGFKITSIDDYSGTSFASVTAGSRLPNYTVRELDGHLPETEHEPYPTQQNFVWHYDGPALTVNNIYALTSLSGKKEWNGDDVSVRPESITVELLQNGEVYDTKTVTAADNWTFAFGELPRFAEDGEEYVYTVREKEVPDGYRVVYVNGTEISEEPAQGYTTIRNIFTRRILRGTKIWVDNGEGDRPENITVHLLQNDEEIDSVTTDASKNWKYQFVADMYDENGEEYVYTVREDVPEGYNVSYETGYSGPITIRINGSSRTESVSYDYLTIYYRMNGTMYATPRYGGNSFPSSINLPTSEEVYFYWHSDGSVNNYYGFKVDDISPYTGASFVSATTGTLPSYTPQELQGTLPETEHSPYPNSQNIVWKYGSADFTITNEYVYTSVSGEKTWVGDKPEERPQSITVELLQNGEVYRTKVVTAEDDWQYYFNALPRDDEEGNAYVYTVRETKVPGYKTEYAQGTDTVSEPTEGYNNIINTYARKKLKGLKLWEDDSPDDRPESITVHLLQNGEEYDSVTTDASKNWAYEFTVDIWNDNGEEYVYTVQEDVPAGYLASYEEGSTGPITVRLNPSSRSESGFDYLYIYYRLNGQLYYVRYSGTSFPAAVNVPSSEVWFYWHTDGSVNGYYGFKIDAIEPYTGTSLISGTAVASLPNYQAQKITDTLPESAHNPYPNSQNLMWQYEGADFTITNRYTMTSLGGEKSWDGDLEEDRPESITVELLQNGDVYRTQEVTAEDNWQYHFSALPKYDENEEEYVYTVREIVPEHYRVEYTDGTETSETPAAGLNNIVNISTRTVLTGSKKWVGDTPEDRPESITVTLLQDGEPVDTYVTDASKNWRYYFTVETQDAEGNEYTYTVTDDADGYLSSSSEGASGAVTVTFDPRSECESTSYDYLMIYYVQDGILYSTNRIGLKFPTSINLPTSDLFFYWHTDSIVHDYYGYKVIAIDEYTGTDFAPVNRASSLPNYPVTETTEYPESAHDPYLDNTNELFHYIGTDLILTNTYTKIDIEAEKVWRNDRESVRPAEIEAELLQNGELYASIVLKADDEWKHTFEDLPRFDENNEEYSYSVREKEVPENYRVSYSNGGEETTEPTAGYTQIINTYTKKVIQGKKTWKADTPELRPETITVQLYRNGELYKQTTADEEHHWEYSFTEDSEDAQGNPYTYEIREVVPENYRVTYSHEGPVTVTFSDQSNMLANNAWLYIVYRMDEQICGLGMFTGTDIPKQVNLPTSDFYVYWHAGNGDNNYYGFKIDSVVPYTGTDFPEPFVASTMPPGEITECTELPESAHSPHEQNVDVVYHYVITDTEIINTYTLTQDLILEKHLDVYENKTPVTFVFRIEAVLDGETVYSDVTSMTFSSAGVQTQTITGLPIGAEVTVTEVYSGAGYTLKEGDSGTKTVTIGPDEAGHVTFTNEYDDDERSGYGVKNTFVNGENGWTWQGNDLPGGDES